MFKIYCTKFLNRTQQMNILKSIEIAVIFFLIAHINSAANDSIYSNDPILALQGNAKERKIKCTKRVKIRVCLGL